MMAPVTWGGGHWARLALWLFSFRELPLTRGERQGVELKGGLEGGTETL